MTKQPFPLPPCGMFIGSGVYNTQSGYLVGSGRIFTVWVPETPSPLELLDRILEENQGNLVQYWAFSGGISPVTFARHYALEDLGMEAPLPNWETLENLTYEDWVDPAQYADRAGAGVLKFVEKAAEKGLYTVLLYATANETYSQRFHESGEYYLGYDMGEIFTFRLEEEHLKGLQAPTLRTMADSLVARVKEHVDQRRAGGWGTIMATSGNFYLDYEVLGGAEVPLVEDFAFKHLNVASALSRGLYRQFELPTWGAHLAHEHYSWIPYSSPYKFPLLRASMYLKYMAGCKILINESGTWHLEASLCEDSPMHATPRVELGSMKKRDPILSAPYVEAARKTFPLIDQHSPISRRYRKEVSDFYDFVKANGTPEGQPESTIALAKGNLDLCGQEYNPNAVVAGAQALADENPAWYDGAPERGWAIIKNVFFPRPPVLAPHINSFLSGTPYGQADIVSFANDSLSAEFLNANYKALLFSGWNTCSEQQYEELSSYVQNGGTLFLALPHLSTNETRNYAAYKVEELVHGGDFSQLLGLKVNGRGKRFYWATAARDVTELGFASPRRFGPLTTCVGDIEIIDPNMEILAVDDEEDYPVLLRRKLGAGTVYFLNSWTYPGAYDVDQGPGATVDSPGFMGYVYRHIARQNRGYVWITDDRLDAGAECNYVSYSYFPQSGTVCLLNIDFDNAHSIYLHHFGVSDHITLAPGEFRLIQTSLGG